MHVVTVCDCFVPDTVKEFSCHMTSIIVECYLHQEATYITGDDTTGKTSRCDSAVS